MTDDRRFLLLLAGLGVVAGVAVFLMRKNVASLSPVAGKLPRVFRRERAAGVDPRLIAFLDWWEIYGSFPIAVDPQGGVRRDAAAQRALFDAKKSNAATLAETAHGRGGALDLYPVLRSSGAVVHEVALNDRAKFAVIGAAAVKFGLSWGGNWASFYDGPHIEVPNWKSLPFPPAIAVV